MSGLKSRRALIYLALAVMAATCLTALLRAFFGAAGPPPSLTVVVLTLLTLIPLAFSRWLRGLELRKDLQRTVLAVTFVFLALLALSAGFYNSYGLFGASWLDRLVQDELSRGTFLNQSTTLLLVAACWWLGLTLGDLRLTSARLKRYLYLCVAALVLTAVFFVSDVSRDLPWLYFTFLFAALVMLGLGRVEEAARRSQYEGSRFTAYWLGHLAVAAGLLLLLTGLGQALGLASGVGIIMAAVGVIVTLLAYPVVILGARVIAFGLSLFVEQGAGAVEEPDLGAAGSTVGQAYGPNSTQHFCVGLFVILFLLLLLFAVIQGARRWREIAQEQEREEEVALPALGDRISEAVEERLERLSINLPGFGGLRRRLAARSIRRIYAALTTLGAERGYARPPARTPYEHLRALRQAFPSCERQVAQITEAYVAVHYGEVPETREALQEIKTAWEQVREAARRQSPLPGQGTAAQGLGRG